ncbi:hypothetical protein PHYPSEUDO_013711 [Phytophthora pseudosyringae]|uniref:Uncharacterized protein n=1 Tax=Phytophthora pseudosyringae TaxID=221518 RepID=A0A8T1V7M5_9STRA|nr:hypothetical protein PHYPSEUDO_013711 [Phytophthora pseudosyringae]
MVAWCSEQHNTNFRPSASKGLSGLRRHIRFLGLAEAPEIRRVQEGCACMSQARGHDAWRYAVDEARRRGAGAAGLYIQAALMVWPPEIRAPSGAALLKTRQPYGARRRAAVAAYPVGTDGVTSRIKGAQRSRLRKCCSRRRDVQNQALTAGHHEEALLKATAGAAHPGCRWSWANPTPTLTPNFLDNVADCMELGRGETYVYEGNYTDSDVQRRNDFNMQWKAQRKECADKRTLAMLRSASEMKPNYTTLR